MVIWKDAKEYFKLLASIEAFSVSNYVVNYREGAMRCWEEGVFFCFRMICSIDIYIICSWFIVSASFTVSLFSICFHDISICESGVLKSATIIVWSEMYFLCFSRVSFMIVGDFLFAAYMLRIESSSWQISLVMGKKCPSLSFLITFGWKFTLFDIRIATPACFLELFAWKFFSHPAPAF